MCVLLIQKDHGKTSKKRYLVASDFLPLSQKNSSRDILEYWVCTLVIRELISWKSSKRAIWSHLLEQTLNSFLVIQLKVGISERI